MDIDPELDLLQGVQDAGESAAGAGGLPDLGAFQMPSLEKMLEMIEKLDMPEEEKASLKDSLTNRGDFLSKLGGLSGAGMGARPGGGVLPVPIDAYSPTTQFYIFFVAIAIIILLFVFIGYKLYKSLVEKERRREEKKKQKQQKKKK